MPIVHEPECYHAKHACNFEPLNGVCVACETATSGRGVMRQRILDNLTTAKAEAVTAGQTVRANVIQNMIDRIAAVPTT